jgi:predicted ArsR family transcriptional regulator
VSKLLAIYYFLEKEHIQDSEKWFTARDLSKAVELSIDQTRRHLCSLRISGDVETKISGWFNVYRFRNGRRKLH